MTVPDEVRQQAIEALRERGFFYDDRDRGEAVDAVLPIIARFFQENCTCRTSPPSNRSQTD